MFMRPCFPPVFVKMPANAAHDRHPISLVNRFGSCYRQAFIAGDFNLASFHWTCPYGQLESGVRIMFKELDLRLVTYLAAENADVKHGASSPLQILIFNLLNRPIIEWRRGNGLGS